MKKIKYLIVLTLFIFLGNSSVLADHSITGKCVYTNADYGNVEVNITKTDINAKVSDKSKFKCVDKDGNLKKGETGCAFVAEHILFAHGCPDKVYYMQVGLDALSTNYTFSVNPLIQDKLLEDGKKIKEDVTFTLDKANSRITTDEKQYEPKFACRYIIDQKQILTLGVYNSEFSVNFFPLEDALPEKIKTTVNIGKLPSELKSCADLPNNLYTNMKDISTLDIHAEKQENDATFNKNTELSEESIRQGSIISGKRFENLLRDWQTPLNVLIKYRENDSLSNYRIFKKCDGSIEGSECLKNDFSALANGRGLCKDDTCGGKEAAYEKAMLGARNIANYCANVYEMIDKIAKSSDDTQMKHAERVKECIVFEDTYKQLSENNILYDLTSDCGFMTPSLKDKLNWVLNVIKIAGPILALGLGTFDFFKTIAAGDAEKEMKNTFKKFMIRIASAVLLLIVPIIISFLLDLFLEDKDGYDPNNPFCDLVKWNEIK